MNTQLRRKHLRSLLSCSDQMIDRYRNDPDYAHLGFPRPRYVGRTPLWDEGEIREWLDSLPREPEAVGSQA